MEPNHKKNDSNPDLVLSHRSNSSDNSIRSFDSISKTYNSLGVSIENKESTKYFTDDSIKLVRKGNWIPLEKRKRRERDKTLTDKLSKSPQLSDALKIVASFNSLKMN